MKKYTGKTRPTWLDRLLGRNQQIEWSYYTTSMAWTEEEVDLRWKWRYSRLNPATWPTRLRWAMLDLRSELRWRYNDWLQEDLFR